ncbi:MAG TPA: fasciclin domain-containing protein, partial [Paludibacter sp.]|nr:fasciclin domain-containing protein [Paludibacter sp.]
MKMKYAGIPVITLLLFVLTALPSCNEEWDEHYNVAPANKSELNIFDFIKSKSDLSKFTQMLEITEYDSILSQSQTFTVWAPTNAALENVDLNNYNQVLKIVTNHVTRFSHPTSEVFKKAKKITLMNGKILEFTRFQNGYQFGDKVISEPDLATQNGIVHIVSQYSPYMRNFWEFINEQEGLDSLRKYLNSITLQTFDEEKSFQDGVFVDSVFKETNYVLDRLAQLKSEDSTYTAVLPDNAAWIDAYNKISPYFKTLPKDGGEQMQVSVSKQMLVRDLFFRERIQVPVTTDSIMSTFGNKFAQPDRFFSNATLTKLSNGNAYVSPQLKNEPIETWLKEYKWEAEYSNYRTSANYSLSALSSIGSGFDISRGYYLYTIPTTTSDLASINNMFVKFALPSTLSAKYNIYC